MAWGADQMYWYYATPSETQDDYPQQVWIESVTVKVVKHAKFKVGIKVVNGPGVGICRFHIWQAVASKVVITRNKAVFGLVRQVHDTTHKLTVAPLPTVVPNRRATDPKS